MHDHQLTPTAQPATGAPSVLVTGFGPFRDHHENPSAWVAEAAAAVLHPAAASAILPVTFDTASSFLADWLARIGRPQLVVHIGLAASRSVVTIETEAVNRRGAGADLAGIATAGALRQGGPPRHVERTWSTRLLAALQAAGATDACLSQDAGDYVCNATLYAGLETYAAGGPPVVFVHIPLLDRVGAYSLGAQLGRAIAQVVEDDPS